jgi:thiamine biosynthesis lipoprotein
MGCRGYLVVHGGSPDLLDRAEQRLIELESLWSRFLPNSDVTRANKAAGSPTVVHEDTLAIVSRAIDAWQQTSGRFDIATLPALLASGYTHSTVDDSLAPEVPGTRSGGSALLRVDYAAGTLTVPAGAAIDLGGIGKGFAADIVAEELMEAGATGALVNLGGDISVLGRPGDEPLWFLGIENPHDAPNHVAVFRLETGGVATSGTTVRHWVNPDGTKAHHVIDPSTLQPSTSGVATATVIASDAATAEVFATAAMMLSGDDAIALLDGVRLAGLVVTDDGIVHRTTTLKDFEA